MDKQFYNNGFTLIEMLIVIVILSSLYVFSLSSMKLRSFDYYDFYDAYLVKKSKAMLTGDPDEIIVNNKQIRFNQNGNVNQANTIEFQIGPKVRKFTIQLGSGVLIEKK